MGGEVIQPVVDSPKDALSSSLHAWRYKLLMAYGFERVEQTLYEGWHVADMLVTGDMNNSTISCIYILSVGRHLDRERRTWAW